MPLGFATLLQVCALKRGRRVCITIVNRSRSTRAVGLDQHYLHSGRRGSNIRPFSCYAECRRVSVNGVVISIWHNLSGGTIKVKQGEPGLLQGFFLCLCDSEAVRLKSSRWKRSLLVFSSGVCLEIAAMPFLGGYGSAWPSWLLAALFVPLGLIGLYASKFGDDRLVESLLVIPKLDLRI